MTATTAKDASGPPVIRLFLVDDHPLVRDGLRARLSTMPNLEIVGEAGSAAEALALVGSVQPDLLLMDVGMKDMNGIDLAALLLQRQPAPHGRVDPDEGMRPILPYLAALFVGLLIVAAFPWLSIGFL